MYKKVDFLNPEDLLFHISEGILRAESSKLLEFRNNYLGYDIKCLVEEYKRDNNNLIFNGKAFFKDIPASKKKTKKYQKRRDSFWKISQQNFLRSVIFNNLEAKTFSCSALIPSQIEKGYLKITDFTDFVYPTKINNVYAIIAPAPITVKSEEYLSHIIAEDGIILINKNGIILNTDEVQLRGYWEQLSLTKYLPTDYKPIKSEQLPADSKVQRSIGELKLWAKELKNYTENNRFRDEIILETDRQLYKSYESVQVCVRIFDHKSRLPIDGCLVKIDFVNQDNEVLDSKIKLAEKGICNTSFQLSDTLQKAQYGIRAYTSHMRNFSENLYGKNAIAVNLIQNNNYDVDEDSIFINFTSEGGKLLYNLENRIVAFIKDRKGNPVEFKGWLRDHNTGNQIIMNTILPGLAVTNLFPTKSSIYQIGSDLNLPVVSNINELIPKEGTNLHVFCRNEDRFKMTVSSNKMGISRLVRILNRGRIVHEIVLDSNQTAFSVSKDFLPNEVLSVKLYDDENRFLSERLIDNKIDVKPLLTFKKKYQFFYSKQASEISIISDSLSNYYVDSLEWNVRIVRNEYNQTTPNSNHLHLLPMNGEEFDMLSSTNKIYIRNLELIGNSVDPDYISTYDVDIKNFEYTDDFSLSISGILKNPDAPYNNEKGKVSITSMSSVPYYTEIYSDEEGEFRFDNLPYEPNPNFIIQARKNVSEGEGIMGGSRYLEIEPDDNSTARNRSNTSFRFRHDLIPDDSNVLYNVDFSTISQNVELDEVVIKDEVSAAVATGDTKDPEKMDWIPKQAKGLTLLKKLYPGKVIRRSIKNPGELEILASSRRHGFVYQKLNIFINNSEEFGSSGFEGLIADRIKYLTLNQNSLAIITTQGSKSRTSLREEDLGIKTHIVPETVDHTKLSFINDYSPRQFPDSDYRKTLYWNPKLLLTKSKEEKIIFRTSNLNGEYQIIASTIHPQLGYISYSNAFDVVDDKN